MFFVAEIARCLLRAGRFFTGFLCVEAIAALWRDAWGACLVSVWYVFRTPTDHLGPLMTDSVAQLILAGAVPRDAWVAPRGSMQSHSPRWQRALEVPSIGTLVDGLTGQRRDAHDRRDPRDRRDPSLQ